MDMVKARRLTVETFKTLGVPESHYYLVDIKWNHRLRTTLGIAKQRYRFDTGYKHWIELSAKAFELMSEEECEITVIHEACHIADYIHNKTSSHGPIWRSYMVRCGQKPDRCAKLSKDIIAKLKNKTSKAKAFCSCTTHMISKKMATQMVKGQRRICSSCRGPLTVEVSHVMRVESLYEPKQKSSVLDILEGL